MFMVFQEDAASGVTRLRSTGEDFQLGGNGLVKKAWEKFGKPVNVGWKVTAQELLSLHFPRGNSATKRLFIDFDPKSESRIGLIEPQVIYAYTFGNKDGFPSWTPLMLQLRDVFDNDTYAGALTNEKKKAIFAEGIIPDSKEEFIEFLYLKEDWNWGRNGSTNAAFIQAGAREYFRQYF